MKCCITLYCLSTCKACKRTKNEWCYPNKIKHRINLNHNEIVVQGILHLKSFAIKLSLKTMNIKVLEQHI